MSAKFITAHEIHDRIGAQGWPDVLRALGVAESALVNRHGPCPACGGKDRFRFDNRKGRGDFFCNHCGAGDGFQLVMRVHGWEFSEARKRVMDAAGIALDSATKTIAPASKSEPEVKPSVPTQRVGRILRESCRIEDCEPAVLYLMSRALWPLPKGHMLRAHPSVAYFVDGKLVGRHPALVGVVRDIAGQFVTVHVTYLTETGAKVSQYKPRKILSKMLHRVGCAVRLVAAGETLGVAEGIETAFSASRLHRLPVWASLNSSLLGTFEPPSEVKRLIVFADKDVGGLEGAAKLMERLQGRVRVEMKLPPDGDWNDVLVRRRS
jgi:putative DNA primase/helicase